MSHAFADLAFTPSVKAVQQRDGSRASHARNFEGDAKPFNDRLGDAEVDFIGAQRSFYLATVSETGWPYLQHRGGPRAFLKVLGRLAVKDLSAHDALAKTLVEPAYRARPQHVMVITIEGFDWNCPQHVPVRFDAEDVQRALEERDARIAELQARLDSGDGAPEGAHKTPLTIDRLKTLLPFDDHEFFLCGPPGFMQALYDGPRDLGVRDERIQAEAFGPPSLKRRLGGTAALPPPTPAAKQATVSFSRTGDAAEWTPERGTLLEFAQGKGLSPPFACRAGHCGSCATRLTAGVVTYAEPTAWRPAEGEVLLCCAVPAAGGGERIELDL